MSTPSSRSRPVSTTTLTWSSTRTTFHAPVEALRALGYTTRTGREHNFVLADDRSRSVDIHAVDVDEHGNGLYPQEDGTTWLFTAEGLAGRGSIAGREVRCLTPDFQVVCHDTAAYEFDADDIDDLKALQARFGVTLPESLV